MGVTVSFARQLLHWRDLQQRGMQGVIRPKARFSLLLLDEKEYYFDDYGGYYYPTSDRFKVHVCEIARAFTEAFLCTGR